MSEQTQETVSLAALSLPKVREENPQVAEALDQKEEKVESIRKEKAELEAELEQANEGEEAHSDEIDTLEQEHEAEVEDLQSEIDDLKEQVQARDEIISDIREADRAEALDDLKSAYAVAYSVPEEEIDVEEEFDAFDEASAKQIRATASMVRNSPGAGGSGVESEEETIEQPGETAGTDTEGGLDEDRKMEIAEEMGLAGQLQEANDLSPQGFSVEGGQ